MKRFRTARDVRHRAVGEELVIVRQDAAEVLALNGVGARVMELAGAGRSTEELVAVMQKEYDMEPDVVRRDVEAFLNELTEAGVLMEVSDP